MAAGMTLRIEDLDELRIRLCRQAKDILTEKDFQPVTEIDGVVSIEEVSLTLIGQMAGLAPYGMQNPKPRILIEGASVASMRKIGADKTHLKLALEENGVHLDSIGFGLGGICDHLSPYAKVSVIGELAVNEWNNLKKPQLFLHDLSVNEWQLFDCRGNAKTGIKPSSIPEKRKIILFREESRSLLANEDEGILIESVESAKAEVLAGFNVALLDLPNEKGMIEALLTGKTPARVYLYFRNGGDDYFKAFPTREQFKWFYAMLLKNSPMDYKDMSERVVHFKGWPKDTIDFMSKVFFELEFVTIRNGLISLEKNSPKRDLTESKAYQARKARMELEQELLYAPSNQLYQYFNQQIGSRDDYKEETKQWI